MSLGASTGSEFIGHVKRLQIFIIGARISALNSAPPPFEALLALLGVDDCLNNTWTPKRVYTKGATWDSCEGLAPGAYNWVMREDRGPQRGRDALAEIRRARDDPFDSLDKISRCSPSGKWQC